jgi:hypothetical protein
MDSDEREAAVRTVIEILEGYAYCYIPEYAVVVKECIGGILKHFDIQTDTQMGKIPSPPHSPAGIVFSWQEATEAKRRWDARWAHDSLVGRALEELVRLKIAELPKMEEHRKE